jgi:hypothetical protein
VTALELGLIVGGGALLFVLLVERLARLRGARAARRAEREQAYRRRLDRTEEARRRIDLHLQYVPKTPTEGDD